MGRNAWALIKRDKRFNVNIYRRGLTFLIIFLLLSVAQGVLISRNYLNEPERDYYATDGITPPVKLAPMLNPNMSSKPLLDPDPKVVTEEKDIPQ